MLGKFFAFAMLVLIILVIVQFSTLSDEDVEKIRAKIEEQQQKNVKPADKASTSKTYSDTQTETSKAGDSSSLEPQ